MDPNKTTSKLEQCATDMIAHTGTYIKSEMEACMADYTTLERMNRVVAERYGNYTDLAKSISSEMKELNACYEQLFPMLVHVNDVEKSVGELEGLYDSCTIYILNRFSTVCLLDSGDHAVGRLLAQARDQIQATHRQALTLSFFQ